MPPTGRQRAAIVFPEFRTTRLSRGGAHLAMHNLDAAVATAHHAARHLGSADCARLAADLKGLREKLAPHTSHTAVREFLQVS